MPSQQSTQSSGTQGASSSSSNAPKIPTRYSIVRDGWGGSRSNFQSSYGLKMTPEDLEEGNAILDSFIQADIEAMEERARSGSNNSK